jgi:TetR/AcrR family transcriptional regulator, regulator of cefoperazone and chloramphenicol sensitivity
MTGKRANPQPATASRRTVTRTATRTVTRPVNRTVARPVNRIATTPKSGGSVPRIAPDPTRSKLLHAAGDVFAEVGFHAATVREISRRAGANVAAVNYHFGDKLELYTAVLRETMQGPSLEAVRIALDKKAPPEETIAEVIKAMLARICSGDNRDRRWRLMMHELSQPTPAMSRVIDETSRPLFDRLCELVGSMIGLPRDHEKTRLCTNSIVGQVVLYAHWRPVLANIWPELQMTPAQVGRIAEHITQFSLAYLRNVWNGTEKAGAWNGGAALPAIRRHK